MHAFLLEASDVCFGLEPLFIALLQRLDGTRALFELVFESPFRSLRERRLLLLVGELRFEVVICGPKALERGRVEVGLLREIELRFALRFVGSLYG